ncbi:putative manganese-dependent inorganic diphosphatase [Adlercreutzia sp. ZJ304]|uniref:putative manganese-dependent inorganic diphosphatase n=1 Tax=Adlercreutzia sp. ZJ304 TaxID=2709791 RepID=UPI0013EA970C|nr:putative manganese-dependent inorganic diphosphatase [Adlercreutzia sp. ZJ304]
MVKSIIVVGHRNPDNDSISSAVAYAYLKNELAKRNGQTDVEYIPARLGQMPPESEWVLAKNGLEAPRVITHVYLRVSDVMTRDPITISVDAPMLEAGRLLKKYNIRSLAVTDDAGKFMGLISTRAIAERYISATDALQDDDPSSSMAVASSLIDSLNQRVGELMATNVLELDEEGLLKEATEDLMASELREGIILDDAGSAIGIMTRSDVAGAAKRRVILVDHNETLQAAPGIEDADVMEVVDHHRIADVSTANPIQFINLPLGSTATIVTMQFRQHGIAIPPAIAEVLLSAIMTDTVILKSPTATDIDREQVDFLANIIGCDPVEFGLEVFRQRGGEDDMPVEDLVCTDSKEFQMGDDTLLIAQHETVNLSGVMEREAEMREYMRKLIDDRAYTMVLLMVTDIMAEGSQFLVEGNTRIAERAFGIECESEGGNWMPGILSRKKQVAARILN